MGLRSTIRVPIRREIRGAVAFTEYLLATVTYDSTQFTMDSTNTTMDED